jgi:hypothetical protein
MSGQLGFYDVVYGTMKDRDDLNFWDQTGSPIQAVAAVNPNTITFYCQVQ